MKTSCGFLNVRFFIGGAWGFSVTELRTYRNNLLYFRGELPYDTNNFLQYAEQIVVDKAMLFTAFTACLDWQMVDDTAITFDCVNWQLTLRLNDRQISFSYDTATDEFNTLVSKLEEIIQRPLL